MFSHTHSILSFLYNQDLGQHAICIMACCPRSSTRLMLDFLLAPTRPHTAQYSPWRFGLLWQCRQYGYQIHAISVPPQIQIIRHVRGWLLLLQYLTEEIRGRNAVGNACALWRERVATSHPESINTKMTGRTNTNALPNRTFIRQLQITCTSVWRMISTQKTIRYTVKSLTARNAWHFQSVYSRRACHLYQFPLISATAYIPLHRTSHANTHSGGSRQLSSLITSSYNWRYIQIRLI